MHSLRILRLFSFVYFFFPFDTHISQLFVDEVNLIVCEGECFAVDEALDHPQLINHLRLPGIYPLPIMYLRQIPFQHIIFQIFQSILFCFQILNSATDFEEIFELIFYFFFLIVVGGVDKQTCFRLIHQCI